MPFGVTDGDECFQRAMDDTINKEGLSGVLAYADNIVISGFSCKAHGQSLRRFLEALTKYSLTFNEGKRTIFVKTLQISGSEVSKGHIRKTSQRAIPQQNFKAQERVVGMFPYYSLSESPPTFRIK